MQTQENCLKSSQKKQREAYAVYLKELERLGLSPDFDVEKNLMEEDGKWRGWIGYENEDGTLTVTG